MTDSDGRTSSEIFLQEMLFVRTASLTGKKLAELRSIVPVVPDDAYVFREVPCTGFGSLNGNGW